MQNNMRTIYVGIFHLFQKTKNMLGIKPLILLHLATETLLLSQTRLSFKNREIAISILFLDFQRSAKAQASLCIFVNLT